MEDTKSKLLANPMPTSPNGLTPIKSEESIDDQLINNQVYPFEYEKQQSPSCPSSHSVDSNQSERSEMLSECKEEVTDLNEQQNKLKEKYESAKKYCYEKYFELQNELFNKFNDYVNNMDNEYKLKNQSIENMRNQLDKLYKNILLSPADHDGSSSSPSQDMEYEDIVSDLQSFQFAELNIKISDDNDCISGSNDTELGSDKGMKIITTKPVKVQTNTQSKTTVVSKSLAPNNHQSQMTPKPRIKKTKNSNQNCDNKLEKGNHKRAHTIGKTSVSEDVNVTGLLGTIVSLKSNKSGIQADFTNSEGIIYESTSKSAFSLFKTIDRNNKTKKGHFRKTSC